MAKCTHCGSASVEFKKDSNTKHHRVASARVHGEAAGKALREGDFTKGMREMITPFVGPVAQAAAEIVLQWKCLRCGKRF